MKVKLSTYLEHRKLFLNLPYIVDPELGICKSYVDQTYTQFEHENGKDLSCMLSKTNTATDITIIHDNDLDGNMAAIILKSYLKFTFKSDEPVTSAIIHGGGFSGAAIKEITAEDKRFCLIILDHSFDKAVYEAAVTHFEHVYWIDHHELDVANHDTEIDTDRFNCAIDSTFSTAEMVQRICRADHHYLGGELDRIPNDTTANFLAYHTHFHDTWQYTKGEGELHAGLSKRASALSTWFYNEPDSRKILEEILNPSTNQKQALEAIHRIIDTGEMISKTKALTRKNIVTHSVAFMNWTVEDVVYRIGYIFHSDDRSNIASDMLKLHKEKIDTALVVYLTPEFNLVTMSLRTTDSGNPVNTLANFFKGGGHRNAAGFTIAPDRLGEFLQTRIFENKKEEK